MPLPALAIGAGKFLGKAALTAGLSKLLGGGGRGGGRYSYTPREFSYTPNEQDPELLLRRRRLLEEIGRGRSRTVDEIGRAGLLGSSAAFGVLGEQERQGLREQEDLTADVFMKRRLEALDLFKDQQDFERRLALLSAGGDIEYGNRSGLMGLEALGGIGEFAGGELEEFLRNRRDRGREMDLDELSGGRYM